MIGEVGEQGATYVEGGFDEIDDSVLVLFERKGGFDLEVCCACL